MRHSDITEPLKQIELFEGLDPQLLDRLAASTRVERLVEPGAFLVREGEDSDDLLLLLEGESELLKAGEGGALHRIRTLREGESLGELAIVDPGPRSGSIRALTSMRVARLPVAEIRRLLRDDASYSTLLGSLSRQLSHRLRYVNEITVAALERELRTAQMRVGMGRFFLIVILSLSFFAYALQTVSLLTDEASNPFLFTILVSIAGLGSAVLIVLANPLPLSFYGLTRARLGRSAAEAVLFTLPLMGALVLAKWIVLQRTGQEGQALFEIVSTLRSANAAAIQKTLFLEVVVYGVLVVSIQEFVARGCVQSSLQHFLAGPKRHVWAIAASNLIFSVFHLFISVPFAVVTLVAGLFWGWLFHRQGNLVGPIVSHALLGVWATAIVGISAFVADAASR